MGTRLINKYKKLHKQKPYGVSSPQYKPELEHIIEKYSISSCLDFGCGQSTLLDELNVNEKYWYDPAIIGKDFLIDKSVDLIICTDVLEHIPENEIENTLTLIGDRGKMVYFQIALFQHGGRFDDGSPLHITVKPREWWREQLKKHFHVLQDLPVFKKPRQKKEWAGWLCFTC
jgi:hypothetical protein